MSRSALFACAFLALCASVLSQTTTCPCRFNSRPSCNKISVDEVANGATTCVTGTAPCSGCVCDYSATGMNCTVNNGTTYKFNGTAAYCVRVPTVYAKCPDVTPVPVNRTATPVPVPSTAPAVATASPAPVASATPVARTATPAPAAPTASPAPRTPSPAPATASPVPATASPAPATASPAPATASPAPATASPAPPTPSPQPPTPSPAPPTDSPAPPTPSPTLGPLVTRTVDTCCQIGSTGSINDNPCELRSWNDFGLTGTLTTIERTISITANLTVTYTANPTSNTFSFTSLDIQGTFSYGSGIPPVFIDFTDLKESEPFDNPAGTVTVEVTIFDSLTSQANLTAGDALFDELVARTEATIPYSTSVQFSLSGPGASQRVGNYDTQQCLTYAYETRE